MPTERNAQIREHAYRLWESEGCPEGKEMDYWLRAERELQNGAAEPVRKARAAAKPTSARAAGAGAGAKKAASTKTAPKTTAKTTTKKTTAKKTTAKKAKA